MSVSRMYSTVGSDFRMVDAQPLARSAQTKIANKMAQRITGVERFNRLKGGQTLGSWGSSDRSRILDPNLAGRILFPNAISFALSIVRIVRTDRFVPPICGDSKTTPLFSLLANLPGLCFAFLAQLLSCSV